MSPVPVYIARIGTDLGTLIGASRDQDRAARALINAIEAELRLLDSRESREVLRLHEAGQSVQAYERYRRANLYMQVTPIEIDSAPWLG